MIWLRQSTASQEVPLGYFVDSTDGNTEETGLTINNTDIKIWKTGATTLASKNSGGATHISTGIYYTVLDATDTDTIGPLVIFVHVSGALTVRLECVVLDEAVYDALFGTSALTTGGAITVTSGRVNADVTHIATAAVSTTSAQLGVNVVQLSTDATAADNAEAFFDGTGYAGTNNVIPTVTTLTGHTAQTGDCFARLGAPAGASVSADIAAIEAQTDDIGAAGAGLTAVPWNASWDAEVQSEVQDALDATLADSVPADGSRPSIAQAVYMLVQFLTERSVSGTTVTVKKVDGSTSLMTFTLNDGTTPTSITRAT